MENSRRGVPMAEVSLEMWKACAGTLAQLPPEDSKVYYFPQGHAEHTLTTMDFGNFPKIASMIPCRVISVKHLADSETDEVYAKMKLIPLEKNECVFGNDGSDGVGERGSSSTKKKSSSYVKTLTQSDANNGGGFSVPRHCAETIFPPLDYNVDPPVQNLKARDVHGMEWNFRHIFRGTPRRHLLTTGWSSFVNKKKLTAGDSVVFVKDENGEILVGIRRSKKIGLFGGNESSSPWNSGVFGGFSSFLEEDEKNLDDTSVGSVNTRDKGKVKPEMVLEAAFLAANGSPFEVVFYPRAGTPEFCVKASLVDHATRISWCTGLRVKMPLESEDGAKITCHVGTVNAVQVLDPVHWPVSFWRSVQVTWDDNDQLQNMKYINPWLVETNPIIPLISVPPFGPRKRMRLQHHSDFLLDPQFPMPSFSGIPLSSSSSLTCISNSFSAGIQSARQSQIGVQSLDLHLNNKQPIGGLLKPNIPNTMEKDVVEDKGNISCLLTNGSSSQKTKNSPFFIFGFSWSRNMKAGLLIYLHLARMKSCMKNYKKCLGLKVYRCRSVCFIVMHPALLNKLAANPSVNL
ncbi:auxin response factor 16-like isoform X2 [Andrographis paniculata]|uniref:auxin response factor 16-like isoform X2 n=1 Tax=Andrographis paniculata TaxID=175694 RepID=UPI0021E6FC10|nr:auxin response factor 16-like isoform X2 [Andrographis paniculata]